MSEALASGSFRCGTVAIVGRPNVGKSSLLNRLIGQKLAITSRRPQTTRHRIAGVLTTDEAQLILLDSPGMQTAKGGVMNRYLNRTARQVAADADVVLFVFDGHRWTDADAQALQGVPPGKTVALVANKIDSIKGTESLVKAIAAAQALYGFADVIPVSARTGKQVPLLMQWCANTCPRARRTTAPTT